MDRPEPPDSQQTPPKTEPTYQPSPYISPKLREKLGQGDSGSLDEPFAPTRSTSSMLAPVIMIVVVLGLGAGIWAISRSNAAREAAKAEAARRAAAADSAETAARADSIAKVSAAAADSAAKLAGGKPGAKAGTSTASAASTTPTAGKPGATTKPAGGATATSKPAPSGGGGEAAAAPKPATHYGIDVGTYLSEDRAKELQTQLATSTGLSGQVVTKTEGGATVYHLVLGSFDSKAAASKKADELSSKGSVNEAHVVPIKG